jgi:hypothetical protein
MSLTADEVREIVTQVLAEQKRSNDLDEVVLKTIAMILTSFGIEEDDRLELKADFVHLRRWRKSFDQATSLTFKVVVTTLVGGFLAALWLGIKTMLGK